MKKPILNVVVGILVRDDHKVLVAQRPHSKTWSGYWEFPGGKIEPNETPAQAIARELQEELAIQIDDYHPWFIYQYEYPKTIVHLNFFRIYAWHPTPTGNEDQRLEWVDPSHIAHIPQFLPAGIKPAKLMALPPVIYTTQLPHIQHLPQEIERLSNLLSQHQSWVHFYAPALSSSEAKQALDQVLSCCHAHQARLLVNSDYPKTWWQSADGVFLQTKDLIAYDQRPLDESHWVVAATEHLAELLYANQWCDLTVLQPPISADQRIDWDTIQTFKQDCTLPLYLCADTNLFASAQAYGINGIVQI